MVKIENELKVPVRVKDTYQRGGNPDYTDWTDDKKKEICCSFSVLSQIFHPNHHRDEGHIALNHLPRKPGIVSCPNCLNSVYPKSRKRVLPWTHYTAFLLTPILCCCIPYIFPCTQGKIHYCPYCDTNLGISEIHEPKQFEQSTWYIDFNVIEPNMEKILEQPTNQ